MNMTPLVWANPYGRFIEEKDGTVSVRKHGGEDLGAMTVEQFAELINAEVNSSLKSFEV